MSILLPDLNPASSLQFQAPRRLNNGGLRVDLKYKGEEAAQDAVYQTCRFRRGYLKEWKDEKLGSSKLKLECLLLVSPPRGRSGRPRTPRPS
jgi:hypothetical protein